MILYIYVFKVIFIQNVGHEDGSHFGNEKQFHRQTTGWLSAAEIRPRLFSHLKARQSPSVRTYAHWLPLIECLASWAAHPQLVRHYVVWILHWWFKAYVSSDMDLKGNEGFQSFQVPQTDLIEINPQIWCLKVTFDPYYCDSNHSERVGVIFSSTIDVLLCKETLQMDMTMLLSEPQLWADIYFYILFVLSKARHASLASVVLCIKPYGAFC